MLNIVSIKQRLFLISLATTGVALLAASVVFVAGGMIDVHRSLVNSLAVQAAMIGSNSTVALAFSNRKDAAAVLNALDSAPNIIRAVIYARDGSVFATYLRPGADERPVPPTPPDEDTGFGLNCVALVRPILLDKERIGSIFIESDLREFYSRLSWAAAIAGVALAGSMALAFLLLARLQKTITTPILELAELTRNVSNRRDYSMRCGVRQNDETGTLAAGFNEMLSQIQARDRELNQHHRHLEEQVALRTAELAQANARLQKELAERKRAEGQLLHSQKMEAIGLLAGGIAHDFNNILTAIIGYGTLTQMKMAGDDPSLHNIDELLNSAQRAVALTQSLLAFSRKQIINPKPVEINGIIVRVVKLLTRLIGEDIKLILNRGEGELVVVADSGQVEQVLMNLATNARDAMPRGGTLTIETNRVAIDERFITVHQYGTPGPYALIAMTDSGAGMDAETVKRIFEPFFTTKEMGRGTGLGLSIVYGIVKQHNGFINVYTEPGQGTTFKIYFPLAAAAKDECAGVVEQATPPRGSETVLIAEDDEHLRQLARSVLEEFGYTLIEARDGEEAIEKIKEYRDKIKLLLLDVIMPKKNGREVLEEARRLIPGVKALFVSGYTADIIHQRGILDEEQDFLSKPVPPRELLKKIREVMDK